MIQTAERPAGGHAEHQRTARPKVGIVILNWNRPDDTIACIRSLERMAYDNWQVVVVDNGSRDDSVARIRAAFPWLHLIDNGRNLGFAEGNNVGVRHLLADGCDYVMLLNDDAEVAPDTMDRLIDIAEADPRIGMIGPTICYFDQPRVVWSAGGAVSRHGEPSHLDVDEEIGSEGQPPRDVDYVTGCAILAKREVVEQIGLLEPRFFIYFEEAEWCARARRAGYRVVHVPDAIMWHKITPTARITSHRYLYLMNRNRLLYLRLTGAGPAALAAAVVETVRTSLSWALRPRHRMMREFAWTPLRGVAAFALGRFGEPPANL